MKFETIKQSRLRTVGLAIAVGLSALSLTACAEEPQQPKAGDPAVETVEGTDVTYTYFDDGSRLTTYADGRFSNILTVCDGADLVEQTQFNSWSSYRAGAGNDISRSVDHPACTDGRLTATDFTIKR